MAHSGGVDSAHGVLDGVGGVLVPGVDEVAELGVSDAVGVHGCLLFIPGGREGRLRPSRRRGQAVRARVAARPMASMASAGLAASVTWQSVYVQMAA